MTATTRTAFGVEAHRYLYMRIRHLNRIRSRRASKQKFWCNTCDAALVGEYGKCPRCRRRNSSKLK